jgi:hypothetical protein
MTQTIQLFRLAKPGLVTGGGLVGKVPMVQMGRTEQLSPAAPQGSRQLIQASAALLMEEGGMTAEVLYIIHQMFRPQQLELMYTYTMQDGCPQEVEVELEIETPPVPLDRRRREGIGWPFILLASKAMDFMDIGRAASNLEDSQAVFLQRMMTVVCILLYRIQ